jgi:type I restriction enzyme S subunit
LPNYQSAKEDGVISGKYHFQPGSVLYSKIRPYLRKAVQVPFEGVCSADIYATCQISDKLEPRFLMYSLVGPSFSFYADRLSDRTRMPKINQSQFLAFPLGFPPRTDQQRIVAHLDRLGELQLALRKLHSQTAAELDALLPAVLAQAFAGQL